MIDLSAIKAGTEVRLYDGATGRVVGSYLSTDGLVLRVKTSADAIITRNVPVGLVAEVIVAEVGPKTEPELKG